jgi:uncharacterized coiled-coil protein SlyX
MSPKCVYGEHEVRARCPTMYWNAERVPCEPELVDEHSARAQVEADFQEAEKRRRGEEDPDFASLLEREPLEEEGGRAIIRPHPEKEGVYAIMERDLATARRLLTLAETACDSAASRIKELEGVLVAVRAKADKMQRQLDALDYHSFRDIGCDVQDITRLVNETLDPCKPWCVLEPGHGGACASDIEFCEDES